MRSLKFKTANEFYYFTLFYFLKNLTITSVNSVCKLQIATIAAVIANDVCQSPIPPLHPPPLNSSGTDPDCVMCMHFMQAAGRVDLPRPSGYRSATYSKVIPIGRDNNGDVYRCTMNFRLHQTSSADDDHLPPTSTFSWASSPPLDVQCTYSVINCIEM